MRDIARARLLALDTAQPARAEVAPAIEVVDPAFPAQRRLLEDKAQLLVGLCTRRAAKSFSVGMRFVRAMQKHPGCSCLYLGLTDESAERALWKDVLKVINRRWELGANFVKSNWSMELPNGSILYLLGMDRDETEKDKLLGGKYAEVAIDEAQAFTIDLEQLVFSVLKPAVADYRGNIGLYGTPGNLKRSLFYRLTSDQDPSSGPQQWERMGFSGHCWSTFDNPYMAENWRQEIEALRAANPLVDQTPWFQQNYLGRWVVDDSKLVYRYQAGRNDFNGSLPNIHPGEWHFVLAIDLGFTDATSFTILAYHDHDRTLYILKSYKKPGLDLTDVSEHAKTLKATYPIEHTTIDGSDKQAVEELNRRLGLNAVAAEKREKAEHIDIMNSEYIQGRIKLGPGCQPLKDEYGALVWDERELEKRKRKEHPGCENHCADGAYYGWRWCWQYLSEALPAVVQPRTPEWYEAEARRAAAELEQHHEEEFRENRRRRADEEGSQWDE